MFPLSAPVVGIAWRVPRRPRKLRRGGVARKDLDKAVRLVPVWNPIRTLESGKESAAQGLEISSKGAGGGGRRMPFYLQSSVTRFAHLTNTSGSTVGLSAHPARSKTRYSVCLAINREVGKHYS